MSCILWNLDQPMPASQSNLISIPVSRPKPLGPEANAWYWNPNRVGASSAPQWFTDRLHEIDKELEVTWSPVHERWLVWAKSPRLIHPVCQGWRLLFIHHDVDHSYLPLSELIFAKIYEASVYTQGSAKAYFNRIVDEMERDDAKREAKLSQEAIDRAMPQFEYSKIKVGYGANNGSKFSTFFA